MKLNQQMIVNAATRYLSTMFSGYFGQQSPKHSHWFDFGFPTDITFEQYYTMYKRNGLGRAGIQRPIQKCWRDYPVFVQDLDPHDETDKEKAVRLAIERLMFWEKLKMVDERSRVGAYGGLVLRIGDNMKNKMEAEKVGQAGLNALVELVPAFSQQLQVAEFETREEDERYGHPKMFQFNEAAILQEGTALKNARQFDVHPSRVHIWSVDGTVFGEPALEAGYNDLITIEKVIGAGGEGFWKEAKSAPVLNIDKDASLDGLATALGVTVDALPDKLDEIVGDWQKGFDELLMLQGIDAKKLGMTLPQPEEFVLMAAQSFASSLPIPMKILMGSQSGERASTEDLKEWNDSMQSRRNNFIQPNIMRLVYKLQNLGIWPEGEWFLSWSDLTEATGPEKMEKAEKMANINQKMVGTGDEVFSPDEIRATMDYEAQEDDGDDLEDDIDEEEDLEPTGAE